MPTFRQILSTCASGLALFSLPHCDKSPRQLPGSVAQPKQSLAAASSAPTVATPTGSATAPEAPTRPPSLHPPANTEGCPQGMVRAAGEYCPAVIQTCEKYHEEYLSKKGNGTVSDRCLKFREPSRCVAKKKKQLDFCIDRYEYPNLLGELPWVLTSWRQAQKLCGEQGKRLCTEDEYNFACEGPEMLPYVNGYRRAPETCNIDREYRRPNHAMQLLTYERCLQNKVCKAELERLDQRHMIGARQGCVSWVGAVDLNGNVNEWVSRPMQEPPHRSGLKGGWWGPVRNRCRPTVRFHKEFDYGYEAGFRCCKGLGPERVDPRYDLERHKRAPEEVETLDAARHQSNPPTKSRALPLDEEVAAQNEPPASTSDTVPPTSAPSGSAVISH